MKAEAFTSCKATQAMIEKTSREGVTTVFHRVREKKTCPFGSGGTCCRLCYMGPCRVKDDGQDAGVCGATAETIAARNFCRMVAAGAAAHSDHAREVALVLLAAARGEAPGFEIKDEEKLWAVAQDLGIDPVGKSKNQLAEEVALKALTEFGQQEGELSFVRRAPQKRQEVWRRLGIIPRGIDREIVEMLHRTHMGVDQEYVHLMLHGMRTALADGWGGSMIATELQDILFGTPVPIRAKVNLGVLKPDHVNIIVHGHEPLLPELILLAVRDEELLAQARAVGAKGINVAGICCTANEILMRKGVPVAGSVLQQELAIATGAVEAMVVDVQCIMQGLGQVARCYHTELFTTSSRARLPGVTHLEFDHHRGLEVAKEIVRRAIARFPQRRKVEIPVEEMDLIAGFSHETIKYILGGRFRASYRPLNDNIINGRIRGVAAVVGCSNPRVRFGDLHTTLVRELIANDVLVLVTGCAAINCAKEGLLVPEAAEMAGSGLREVCEAVGMPPVLHCGSCVDNSRLLIAATEIVKEGGLGEDISEVPLCGCAPEWMSEKAIAIGQYFVASGVTVGFGVAFPTTGSAKLSEFVFGGMKDYVNAHWFYEPDPVAMARTIIAHIDAKRKALGIDVAKERVLYDMDMRRKLEVV
ncbi:anaerobic carbon-monoxide dehydrogenase catalytic subunit [Ammonifex thiophilus]|uniref:Carbon monoxide dehydrogenase n=1 Tax=Ammonifex thiophilus TaxID=444093 RepID=A0A3D8P7K8_9THEO|nr:anaerobic carbon-monoxide dehydrogenase catalytic subunit [Ammonifex thiophilus]RDV84862.1 anaerobic carbon-monoxide dehydrogenase catalytic subunit [Ammonifex thiophilus]